MGPDRRTLARRAVVVAVLGLAPNLAHAQALPLKRDVPVRTPEGCPRFSPAGRPTGEQSDEARRLTQLGQEAALNGDQRGARDFLRQAANLNPADPAVAYQLGRAHEGLAEAGDAALQFCRYLALAPAGGDAPDVRARLQRLATAPTLVRITPQAAEQFRAGVAELEADRPRAAAAAFTGAVTQAPAFADAYYDRALARAELGENALAAEDLQKYLALQPQAPDRAPVRARIDDLESSIPHPGRALTQGLLVPGLGQGYTGRWPLGAVAFAAAAGSYYFASRAENATETREYIDPNGYPVTFPVTVRKYPNLAAGIGAGAAITVIAAAEAYFHARGAQSAETRVSLLPTPRGVALALRFPTPRL